MMIVTRMLNRLIAASFRSFGLEVCRVKQRNHDLQRLPLQVRLDLNNEIEAICTELIFPELPSCERRIELMAKLIGTSASEAMYILEFLHKSSKLEGDVCEFGVAQGATSALLANEIRQTQKNLWLFDSFMGLPKPTDKDVLIDDIFSLGTIDKYEGAMSCQVNEVKSRLEDISFPFSRVKIIPGFIEDTINYSDLPDKVCFAYVDFDFYRPTSTALRFLNKRLLAGGFAIVDDYGFFTSGAKEAVDELIREYPGTYEMILPHKFAGQFCIIQKNK